DAGNRRVELRVTYSTPPAQPAPPPPTTTTTTTTNTKTKPGSPGSEGSVAVAAAIAVNIPHSDTSATIGGGATVVAQGTVTVRGKANSSDLALADGSATNAPNGSVTVGAAVALNVGTTDNHAAVAGATVTGDGVTVEAVMLDNNAGL